MAEAVSDRYLPASTQEFEVLEFLQEALDEGEEFLKNQPNYNKIDETIRLILSDRAPELKPKELSTVTVNEFGRIANLAAAQSTDIKPFWTYRTFNPRYQTHAALYGKIAEGWFTNRGIDRKLGQVAKLAYQGGASYAHLVWDSQILDNNVIPTDVRDVIPFRPTSPDSLQDAAGAIIRYERTTNSLLRQFPTKGHAIKADRDGFGLENRGTTRAERIMGGINGLSPFWALRRLLGSTPAQKIGKGIPVCDVFYFYLHDPSINEESHPIEMGEWYYGPGGERKPANNWSYIVSPKQPKYPRMRLIIATRHGVLYDGPNIYWHGMIPLPKLILDPWPQTWLGKSPLWDCIPLQHSLDELYRAIDDHVKKVLRPGVMANKGAISNAVLTAFDPRKAGQKLRTNPGGEVKLEEIPDLDPLIERHIERITARMEVLAGVRDFGNLIQLGQLPEGNTIEKLIQAMAAEMRARSRSIEVFVREFATMLSYNIAQFYTVPRRMSILGDKGQTIEDFDIDPGSLIPDHTSDDYDTQSGELLPGRSQLVRPRYDRTREFMRQFQYHIKPGSLLESAQMPERMLYLTLYRDGAMDIWSMWEKLGIYGGEPVGQTIMERLQAMAQMGLGPGGREGRPPTGQQAPEMRGDGRMTETG